MPNEYTQNIFEGDEVSFPQFAIQCARSSGVFLGVLESKGSIPEKFEPSDEPLNNLRAAMARLAKIEDWTDETASKMATAAYEREVTEARVKNEQVRQLKKRYEEMFSKTSAWEPPSLEHRSLKDLMLSKLGKSINSDCQLMEIPKMRASGTVYREKQIELVRQEIIFHSTQYQKEVEGAAKRSDWVRQLNESLLAASV